MKNHPVYCRHYNKGRDIWSKECDAGVSYASVMSKDHAGHPYPCYNAEIRHLCPLWQPPTEERIEAEKEVLKLAGKFMENFAAMLRGENKNCLCCGTPVDKLEQVSRDVYARPCGCRQYQGQVPNSWKDK